MVTKIDGYVDTSALIAFVDQSDSYHPLFQRLFSEPPALITTTLAVAGGHAGFLCRYDSQRALQFLSLIDVMKPLRVLGASAKDQAAADLLVREFSDQNLTMTDAIGLHVMSEKKVDCCWSTKFLLGLTGTPLIIHQH